VTRGQREGRDLEPRPPNPAGVNGKLILTIRGAIAGFEREMMLERQRERVKAAKKAARYKGRALTRGSRLGRSAGSRRRGWAGLGSRCGWRRGAVDLAVAGERLVART
jgi:resolvase-like protein